MHTLLSYFLTVIALTGCASSETAHLAGPIVIPFELRGDFAVVEVTVNGIPARLILDTGAGALVLYSAFARTAMIKMLPNQVGTAEGTKRTAVQIGRADSVRIGAAGIFNPVTAAVDFDAVRAVAGQDIRGALGYEFFKRYVVALNYDKQTMTLTEPDEFTYSGAGTVVPISIERNQPVANVRVTTRTHGELPARMLLDLGTTGFAMKFSTRFARANNLYGDTVEVRAPFGAGVGGVTYGQILRLPRLAIENIVIERPSVALSMEEQGSWGNTAPNDGTIGGPVFTRMGVITDYAHSRMIFEAARPLDSPDSVDASGLYVALAFPGQRIMILNVIGESAGAKAGLAAGDEIVSVDGAPASTMSVMKVRSLLRQSGQTRTMSVRRGTRTFDVRLALHQII